MTTYLVDTIVLSEARKGCRADPLMQRWFVEVPPRAFYLSAITILEIRRGILRLARRSPDDAAVLDRWLAGSVLPAYNGRILPFGATEAMLCGAMQAEAGTESYDSLIGATAAVHGLVVLTRNMRDFRFPEVTVIDPFVQSPS
ncbi:type II toxin-antitoxin system VapC family toxin [Jiella mangrovi]|uniref:Type II toxin-antitoxin system VapC family toxin n=1 Tax=Jiella mangrovi TaxID=2821407 RepID=A0ABS4BKQ3_9HYPH|nr:type II toxin-antitoxin system VapC family toxin [Jiella mangrovi]MBP0616761.1 type II toxin-antitoxin system VapC family toxin [Jiella mangrovi]